MESSERPHNDKKSSDVCVLIFVFRRGCTLSQTVALDSFQKWGGQNSVCLFVCNRLVMQIGSEVILIYMCTFSSIRHPPKHYFHWFRDPNMHFTLPLLVPVGCTAVQFMQNSEAFQLISLLCDVLK